MTFTHLSITGKLAFLVITMIFLIVITTAVSFYSFDRISQSYTEVEAKAVPDILGIFRIRMTSDRLLAEIQGFIASGNKSEITEFETTLTEFEELYDKYCKPERDGKENEMEHKILVQKEQIVRIAYDIFAKYEQRSELLKELENTETTIETFYAANRDELTREEREGLDGIVLAAESLLSESLKFIAWSYSRTDEQKESSTANVKKEIEYLKVILEEYLNNSGSGGLYENDFTNSIRHLLKTGPAIVRVSEYIRTQIAEVEKFEDDLLATLQQALALRQNELRGLTANVTHTIQNAKFFTVSLLLLFVALSSAIGFQVSKVIVSSISKLAHSTQRISEGDFGHRTEKLGNDEIGILADSFNEMARRLEHTTTTVENLNREIVEREKAESDKEKLETQLRQAHKMEAIGTLAGGIAHDFNNILGSMIGYADLALQDIPEGSVPNDNLKQVLIAGLRAKDLVKQILTFSRPDEQQQRPEHISPIVDEALKLLRSSLPSTIEIRQNIEAASSVIMADSTQIHQILINLCTNATKAMEGMGGVLEVSLTDVDLESEVTYGSERLPSGQYVELIVKDTGRGMDGETMERIFEPFFTTRAVGEGTGMGLSAVHGIVKKHGGVIAVDSEPGKGTTFSMCFPRIGICVLEENSSLKAIGGQGEVILVVDDEEPLANMTKQMLERTGYKVVSKTSSTEAFETFRAEPDKFDLVITDHAMPGMTGKELARAILDIRPDVPIILCTGYAQEIDSQEAESMGIKGFIMKPVLREEIIRTIRNLLDRKEIIV